MTEIQCYVKTAQEAVDFIYDWFITKSNPPAFSDGECFAYDPKQPELRCAVACLFPLNEMLKYAMDVHFEGDTLSANPERVIAHVNNMFGLSEFATNPIQRVHDNAAAADDGKDAGYGDFTELFQSRFKENLRDLCIRYNLTYPGSKD